MGRRKNEVWGSFNEVRVDGVLRAKCKKCEETEAFFNTWVDVREVKNPNRC